jgi:hypothetical protein
MAPGFASSSTALQGRTMRSGGGLTYAASRFQAVVALNSGTKRRCWSRNWKGDALSGQGRRMRRVCPGTLRNGGRIEEALVCTGTVRASGQPYTCRTRLVLTRGGVKLS